jgi:hypothetical protein
MTDWNEELFRMVATEASEAVRSHPEWITQDTHLRAAAMRLESERLLTPDTVAALLEPIFRARIPPEEMVRLVGLLEAGEVEKVSSTLRAVFTRYMEEQRREPPPLPAS